MGKYILRAVAIFLQLFVLIGCSSNDDKVTNQNNSRNIKYEITGNYSGQLTVVYNDNVSGNTVVTVTKLPWSKEITYQTNVQVIGIGASSVVGQYGSSGQSASLKIYSDGIVVKSETAATNANGVINFSPLAYGF